MKPGLLSSVVYLLAGASSALQAQTSPMASDAAKPVAAPAPVAVSPANSPYWPNPAALENCEKGPLCPSSAGHPDPTGDPRELAWGSMDYLIWRIKNGSIAAPLVTAGGASQGVLGAADTSVLFGNSKVSYDTLSGLRLTAGFWLTDHNDFGIEGSGFFLERKVTGFTQDSSAAGSPLLARPVFNVLTGTETVELVSSPGTLAGGVSAISTSGMFNWDIDLVSGPQINGNWRSEYLAGFRAVHLDEQLNIFQNTATLGGAPVVLGGGSLAGATSVSLLDRFETTNNFYGTQLGWRTTYQDHWWYGQLQIKTAIGVSHEVRDISGQTTGLGGGATTPVSGGLLALSSNSGRRTHDEFAVVPELNLHVGCQLSACWRIYAGYTFLYWSDVARPGDQVVRVVNPGLLPTSQSFGTVSTPQQPTSLFSRTDFWAQGFDLGVEFRY